MSNWKNNLSYGYTWMALLRLKQINVAFEKSKDLKMSQLAFFNPSLDIETLKTDALNLANTLDNAFTIGMGAKYESGVTQHQAVADMVEIMVSADRTLEDLAITNDDNYRFLNEAAK
ncbi:MAG: hypothetical protein MI922_08905 [Bacteroidales bacterium]|nr:hypothetical protein [Bacteroidales bacterium]